MTRHHRQREKGMTLFEVILALALFSAVAVALVVTINAIGQAALEARSLRTIEQGLEGVMDEYSKNPQIAQVEREIKAGKDGVSYKVRIQPLDKLKNQDGAPLTGLFHVQVTARWEEDGHPLTMSAETWRYAGMYLPAQ